MYQTPWSLPAAPPLTPPLPDWPVWEEEQDSLSSTSFSSLLRKKKACALFCSLPGLSRAPARSGLGGRVCPTLEGRCQDTSHSCALTALHWQ